LASLFSEKPPPEVNVQRLSVCPDKPSALDRVVPPFVITYSLWTIARFADILQAQAIHGA